MIKKLLSNIESRKDKARIISEILTYLNSKELNANIKTKRQRFRLYPDIIKFEMFRNDGSIFDINSYHYTLKDEALQINFERSRSSHPEWLVYYFNYPNIHRQLNEHNLRELLSMMGALHEYNLKNDYMTIEMELANQCIIQISKNDIQILVDLKIKKADETDFVVKLNCSLEKDTIEATYYPNPNGDPNKTETYSSNGLNNIRDTIMTKYLEYFKTL